MISIENTEARIKNIVKAYRQEFEEEYHLVAKEVLRKRLVAKDKYASTGGEHVVQRQLLEYPEKLSIAMIKELDEEESTWFATKEGQRWFAKTFPEFRVAEDI